MAPSNEQNKTLRFRDPDKWPSTYSPEYCHFDTLIWQIPAWSTAVFAGLIAALEVLSGKPTDVCGLDVPIQQKLLLLGGLAYLLVSGYTLLRFRIHQTYTRHENPPLTRWFPGAQTFLQFVVWLQSVAVLAMLMARITVGVVVLVLLIVTSETYVWFRRKHAEELRAAASNTSPA